MTGRHHDLDVLAHLAEGLLDDETAASVRGHLGDCALCAASYTELSEVSRVLAAAPMPAFPDSLAARLDAAILAESTRGAPVIDLASRRRAKITRALSVAAAAVVVGGVGVAVANGSLDGADEHSQFSITAPTPVSTPSFRVMSSHRNYTAAELGQPNGTRVIVTDTDTRLTAQQLGCVGRTAPSGDVTMVDVARYEGRPALVIFTGTTNETIYVAGDHCSADQDDLIARFPAS